MNRLVKTLTLAAPLVLAASFSSNSAEACGGCFVPPAENTVVSGHRMALSISQTQTVLWDQIQYQGDPEDFSWVLPIKPGARIEAADNAWFETLEASTKMSITAPPLQCQGGDSAFGCGQAGSFALAEAAGGDFENGSGGGVTVVKQETVGPYDSVTLSSEDPAALTQWLESHNYDIPDEIKPIIASYVEDGFDFIALRLTPGKGVNLMSPVRVVMQGASPVLPLRMVAAGTGAFTGVVLYVIGEGRWTTENHPEFPVPFEDLEWDGSVNESNYASLRTQTLSQNGGKAWISTYASGDNMFGQGYYDEWDGQYYASGIGNVYIGTMLAENGSNAGEVGTCQEAVSQAGQEAGVIVDPCDHETGECAEVGAGEIDARKFACGELTDLATALVGMHPADVWVTRLEANLPRFALAEDLQLKANSSQATVLNYHETPKTKNYECPMAPGEFGSGRKGPPSGTPFILAGLGALAAALLARRRAALRA
ncbi:MAG: DUF2330 domain-containing protein [Polyangiaceae bacterium]|nr:DUF2330 domain-containing protein [Polyangiaceae bacterium]